MSIRTARVTGPIDGGRGRPFGSPPGDLAKRGYRLEEFLLTGTARSYEPRPGTSPGLDGHWDTQPGADAGYVTRMYVVRPADPADFSGVVVVNWQNVTAGIDLGQPPAEIYRGHAWVGVTAQRVAVDGQAALVRGIPATRGLREWDPARYGTLHHPGDAWSYDIFTQAGRAVAGTGGGKGGGGTGGGVDPLGGLVPRTVLASGGSQSAIRLGAYLNLAQAGERVFDGFLLTVHWGMCSLPPDQALWTSFTPREGGLTAGSARIRDDTGVPVLVLCSESETLNNYPVRQPDSETFRFWEMAGTAHAAGAGFEEIAASTEGLELHSALPDGLSPNTSSWDYVADAALRHLVAWVEEKTPPPVFPPIEVEPGEPAVIRRDAWGNAVGGMRLPHLVAATARHRGSNAAGPAAALFGESVPFTPEQLADRYRGHRDYLDTWNGAVDDLLADGLDLGPHVDQLRALGRSRADELFPTP